MKKLTGELFDECIKRYPQLESCGEKIFNAFTLVTECYKSGGKVLACGNGGSASDAEHITGELMNKFRLKRPVSLTVKNKLESLGFDNSQYLWSSLQQPLCAISLVSQTSLTSAISNDIDPDMVFAQQVYGYGKPKDILFALSTSGNSPNVLNAAKIARLLDMNVIGFTGENGGKLKSYCQCTIMVPASQAYKIQELHLPVYHILCAMLEQEFFG
jgi:phosphoheptose isomerase